MKTKKSKAAHKDGMRHVGAKGLERDSKGKPIPMRKRLPEDRAAAHKAAKRKK